MKKSILHLIILFATFACTDSNKSELNGHWKVVRYEYFIEQEQQPSTEWNEHWSFEKDSIRIIKKGESEIVSNSITLTEDSILFESGVSWSYVLQNDTLIVSQVYESSCFRKFNLYSVRIENSEFGKWPKEQGLAGDWHLSSTYHVHPDSISFPKSKHHFYPVIRDLHISEDSIYEMDYPIHLDRKRSYWLVDDTMRTELDGDSLNYHFELIRDTLLRSYYFQPNNYMVFQEFHRDEFDQGNINYLKNQLVDKRWFYGVWDLVLSEEDSTLLNELAPKYQLLHKIDFRPPCWPIESDQIVKFEGKNVHVRTKKGTYDFTFSFIYPRYHNHSCVATSIEVYLSPIVNGERLPISLLYDIEEYDSL